MVEIELAEDIADHRPGWYVAALEATAPNEAGNRAWKIIRWEAIDDEWAEVIQVAIAIVEAEVEQEPLNLVLQNFQRFFGYVDTACSRFEPLISRSANPTRRMSTEAATILFEWLESVRAFLNHTEVRLKRQYGPNSEQLKAFKTATVAEYDGGASYRFLNGLRNVGHVSFPPVRLTLWERAAIGQTPREEGVHVVFDREALLHEGHMWKASVRDELQQRPAHFDVAPPMIEMMQALERIRRTVSGAERETLIACVEFLSDARSLVGPQDQLAHLVRTDHPRHLALIPIRVFGSPRPEGSFLPRNAQVDETPDIRNGV